jgi:hypothetical protein
MDEHDRLGDVAEYNGPVEGSVATTDDEALELAKPSRLRT